MIHILRDVVWVYLPNFAWNDGNLAEAAGQLGNNCVTSTTKSTQPDRGLGADESPCKCASLLLLLQTEEISDENKSIVWFLVKQVRPGMDLSRVVLPTFILEPRSFLDKLSDHYYHADLLSE